MAPSICDLARKVLHRSGPSQAGIGPVIQEREQSSARRRLLDQVERLREPQRNGKSTEIPPSPPMRLGPTGEER